MERYRLGKKPARPDAVKLKFSSFFDAVQLPKPLMSFGHYVINQPFKMLGNDRAGDCVWAGAAHETMVWAREKYTPPVFNDADVLSDYTAVTGYNPADPSTDNGTDMEEAAKYRRKTGIRDASGVRHKIDAYVALKPGDVEQIALATYLTAGIGIGVRLPDTAERQFDAQEPWSVVRGAKVEGGHYISCLGRNKLGNFLVVTWGRLHAVEPAFLTEYMDEGIAYLSLEALEHKLTPDGFDAAGLRAALPRLGG